jgi:hypothetical protein
MNPKRLVKFVKLQDLREKYKRKNQYQYGNITIKIAKYDKGMEIG